MSDAQRERTISSIAADSAAIAREHTSDGALVFDIGTHVTLARG